MNQRLNPGGRELIEVHLCDGRTLQKIARPLRVAPSTISRKVAGNGGTQHYQAQAAQARADGGDLFPICAIAGKFAVVPSGTPRKSARAFPVGFIFPNARQTRTTAASWDIGKWTP